MACGVLGLCALSGAGSQGEEEPLNLSMLKKHFKTGKGLGTLDTNATLLAGSSSWGFLGVGN